jgi:hypothetical protein
MRFEISLRFLRAVFKDSGTPLCVPSASKRVKSDLFKNEQLLSRAIVVPTLLREQREMAGSQDTNSWEDDMKRRRRTETTIETYEVLAIRTSRGAVQVWCPECGALARMVEPEAAARLAGISTRSLYGQLEAGRLHYEENKEGLLLICLKSVLQSA